MATARNLDDDAGSSFDRLSTPDAPRSVLVVDDDPVLARSLSRALVAAGWEVGVAHGGEEALRELGRGAFDVVLSDILMPGMTGVDLFQAARAIGVDAAFLLMTGSQELAARPLEGFACISKPMTNEELIAYVENAWRSRRACKRLGA